MSDSYEEHSREMMVDAIMARRGRATEFVPPKDKQRMKARNVIGIHWKRVGIKSPPSFVPIMLSIIDHVNEETGATFPGVGAIASDTGYHRNSVAKALEWAERNIPFLVVERRRGESGRYTSHAYHVDWNLLEEIWTLIDLQIRAENAARRDSKPLAKRFPCTVKGVHGHAHSRVCTVHAQSRVCSNHSVINHSVEPLPEGVTVPVTPVPTPIQSTPCQADSPQGHSGKTTSQLYSERRAMEAEARAKRDAELERFAEQDRRLKRKQKEQSNAD
jgi:hypothetical protein